jgi:hypothetical protein
VTRAPALLALVLAAAGACEHATAPTPGPLRVQLTQPTANSGLDAAILLSVSGPAAPTIVAPGSGLRVFPGSLGTTTVLIVTGSLTNGATLATLSVPDTRQVTQYKAVIRQIARPAAAGYAIRDTTGAGYAVKVLR